MVEAFLWGALGASALLAGALIAYLLTPRRAVIAIVMAWTGPLVVTGFAASIALSAL